jgi:hypothetical protein
MDQKKEYSCNLILTDCILVKIVGLSAPLLNKGDVIVVNKNIYKGVSRDFYVIVKDSADQGIPSLITTRYVEVIESSETVPVNWEQYLNEIK